MIKDLPKGEKPREKAMRYGIENLSDAELLAIILRCGIKNKSAVGLSLEILREVGNFYNLSLYSVNKLSQIKGIGKVKAISILAAIEMGKRSNFLTKEKVKLNSSILVYEYFKNYFKNLKQEVLLGIFLDNQKKLISYKKIFVGTINCLTIHPREIFKEAILNSASCVILVHNHPSGNIKPSNEDIESTKRIVYTGKIVGIPIIDHLIITNNGYYSFLEKDNLE